MDSYAEWFPSISPKCIIKGLSHSIMSGALNITLPTPANYKVIPLNNLEKENIQYE